MPSDKYDIASAALILIGADPVSSFGTGDQSVDPLEQLACYHLYDTTIEDLISQYPWRFATKQTELSYNSTAPGTKWDAAWDEPADALSIESVVLDDAGNTVMFDRQDGQILCNITNTSTLYAIHTYVPSIGNWPAYFSKLAELAMAAQLCFPLSAKLDLLEALERKIDAQMRYARNADARQQTTKKLRTTGRNSIMDARRITGFSGRY